MSYIEAKKNPGSTDQAFPGFDQQKGVPLIGRLSIPQEQEIPTPLLDQGIVSDTSDFIRCFRHEGKDCPRCDGSGYRPRAKCACCGVPARRPSQGGKALSPERGTKNWKELRSLPVYCMDCNPRFFGARLALFEGMGG